MDFQQSLPRSSIRRPLHTSRFGFLYDNNAKDAKLRWRVGAMACREPF